MKNSNITPSKRITILAMLAAFLFSSFTAMTPVNAESLCTIPNPKDESICHDAFYNGNNILYYDPNAKECVATPGTTTTTTGPLTGDGNAEKIFLYLVSKGLTAEQAAGILGNFQQESSFIPSIIQGNPPTYATADYVPVNGVGFGIAQWTFTARQAPLMNLAKSTNRSVIDLSAQLDFLWQELNGTHAHALATLKAESTPERAAYVFHRDFEGSADSEATVVLVRGGNARKLYEQYKNLSATADEGDAQNFIDDPSNPYDAPTNTPASSCAATGSTRRAPTAFIDADEFTLFNQCQQSPNGGSWASKRTPRGQSMCQEASIPTSLAIIASNITGTTITPAQTIDYYTQHDLWYAGGGSLLSSPLSAAGNYGLKVEAIVNKGNVAEYNNVFDNGGLIMAVSTGTAPFTSHRHAIVIRGITNEGNFMIADPKRDEINTIPNNQLKIEKILTDIRSDDNSVVYAFYNQ